MGLSKINRQYIKDIAIEHNKPKHLVFEIVDHHIDYIKKTISNSGFMGIRLPVLGKFVVKKRLLYTYTKHK